MNMEAWRPCGRLAVIKSIAAPYQVSCLHMMLINTDAADDQTGWHIHKFGGCQKYIRLTAEPPAPDTATSATDNCQILLAYYVYLGNKDWVYCTKLAFSMIPGVPTPVFLRNISRVNTSTAALHGRA